MKTHHVRKRVSQFSGAAQGDLLVVGAVDGFVVLVHGMTVSQEITVRDPCG
ncbi:hypothetical protein [Streptomyces sp. NBC_00467]|uniref:hypothetical protein n=1 Tax=Streptomyces sp. NBC_00467 TaxID=2975752 RepID=UPI002E19064B